MVAVQAGHKETVQVFLQQQCELNIQENVSNFLAIKSPICIQFLQTHGWSVLHISVAEGMVDIVELLIDPSNEVDLTLQDKVYTTL